MQRIGGATSAVRDALPGKARQVHALPSGGGELGKSEARQEGDLVARLYAAAMNEPSRFRDSARGIIIRCHRFGPSERQLAVLREIAMEHGL